MLDLVMLLQVLIWAVFATAWGCMSAGQEEAADLDRRKDRWGMLVGSGIACVVLYLLRVTEIAPLFPLQRGMGVVISLLGLVGAIYSRAVLGRQWTVRPARRSEEELVEQFPYNLVRHPIYGAQLLMCVGTALSASNVVVGVIFIGGSVLVLRRRAAKEEAVLNRSTRGGYAEKFGRKGRFFPMVGRMK